MPRFPGSSSLFPLALLAACNSFEGPESSPAADAGDDAADTGGDGSGGRGSGGTSTGGKAAGGAAAGGTDAGGTSAGGTDAGDASADADADAMPDYDGAPGSNPLDRFVDATSGDDANDGRTAATAYENLYRALADVAPGATLWVLDGDYGQTPPPSGPSSLTVADGARVRALHPGNVTLSVGPLVFSGSGVLEGVHMKDVGRAVVASSGDVELSAVSFENAGGGCDAATRAALDLSGDVKVTLRAGALPAYTQPGSAVKGFAHLADDAELIVVGGVFEELSRSSCSPSAAFTLLGTSRLELNGVTMNHTAAQLRGGFITFRAGSPEMKIVDSTIDGLLPEPVDSLANRTAIVVDSGGSPKLLFMRSRIQNLGETGVGIAIGQENALSTPNIQLQATTISGGAVGIAATGSHAGRPILTLLNSHLEDNTVAGLQLDNGGMLTMMGGSVRRNGTGEGALGGLVLRGDVSYTVKVRAVIVEENPPGTRPKVAAIVLRGDATSSFDFGTVDDSGESRFTANGVTTFDVGTQPALVTYAVGNLWNPNVQGASAEGTYEASNAGGVLDARTGEGTNYTVTTGALRLAESP